MGLAFSDGLLVRLGPMMAGDHGGCYGFTVREEAREPSVQAAKLTLQHHTPTVTNPVIQKQELVPMTNKTKHQPVLNTQAPLKDMTSQHCHIENH